MTFLSRTFILSSSLLISACGHADAAPTDITKKTSVPIIDPTVAVKTPDPIKTTNKSSQSQTTPTIEQTADVEPEIIQLAQLDRSDTALPIEVQFTQWQNAFIEKAVAKGYARDLVTRVVKSGSLYPKALERDKSQPEFTAPIWKYVDNASNQSRINSGKTHLAENETLFTDIEARYGVDRHILTAIWGLESAYGKIQGKANVISGISTLAFEGRRGEFFESQLFAILDMVSNGQTRLEQLKGSWAGAMGMTQFIPTTYKDYAVDFNADGNIDIWNNKGDALGSAANYLSRVGWRKGEPVLAEVKVGQGFDYGLANGTKRSLSDWQALGVRPANGAAWSQEASFLEAKLLVPAGANGPVFVTFKNFDMIKRYNNSTSYALGISNLAHSLNNQVLMTTAWPRDDAQVSRTDIKRMQRVLTQKGYNTKGVDGQIGPNTRKAIRAWQRDNGLPADGYVEKSLFTRIMG